MAVFTMAIIKIMKKQAVVLLLMLFSFLSMLAQSQPDSSKQLFFLSDTQQPMFVEKLLLKPDHNLVATHDIFGAVLKDKPSNVYMLGDVVALGYAKHKWKKVDQFLESCTKEGIGVCAVLGNHEVMIRKRKGERNFQKRFAMNVSTGYVSVTDSVAVVLLNSNFSKMTVTDQKKQQQWYNAAMTSLDASDSIKAIIVCCHHAPYTNSKIVKGSIGVQQAFVPAYIKSKKAQLFITGHAHTFEHFDIQGKDFLVIGGGGGLHQPTRADKDNLPDLSQDYKPMFHYLTVRRVEETLIVSSHYLKNDFSGFETGLSFTTAHPQADTAEMQGKKAGGK
jgi:UDP-2,3-diacylglucosamine pyrophosphatase LpxH